MSQKLVLAIIGIVVLAAGAFFFMQSKSDDSRNAAGNRQGQQREENSVLDTVREKAGSFAEILQAGAAQECHFRGVDPDTGSNVEGEIKVSGDNFRLKTESVIDGEDVKFNMIQKDKVVYMWADDNEMPAIKMDMSMFADVEGQEAPESPMDWLKDPESNIDYNCSNWSLSLDTFEPPRDVEFLDMFGEMNAAFGTMLMQGMEIEQ